MARTLTETARRVNAMSTRRKVRHRDGGGKRQASGEGKQHHLVLKFCRETVEHAWKVDADPADYGWFAPDGDDVLAQEVERKLEGWPAGQLRIEITGYDNGKDACETMGMTAEAVSKTLEALHLKGKSLPHRVRRVLNLPGDWSGWLTWYSTRSDRFDRSRRMERDNDDLKLNSPLPEVPEEVSRKIARLAIDYLARFDDPDQKLLALEALTKVCKGELRKQLTPVLRGVLANCTSKFSSLQILATAVNALLTDLDAALVHPCPRRAGDVVPSNLNAVRSQRLASESGYLYIQPKSGKNLRDVTKRTAAVLPPDEEAANRLETIAKLKIVESPREDTRSLRRDILGW